MENINLKTKSDALIWIITALAGSILVYRSFFYHNESFVFYLVNDLLVLPAIILLTFYIIKKIRKSNPPPTALVLNSGIILVFSFFVIILSELLLPGLSENITSLKSNPDLQEIFVLSLYSFLMIIVTSYWFAVIEELYFYKRYSAKSVYFYLMIVFMLLSAVIGTLFNSEQYNYIKSTFEILSGLLLIFNSLKISWIAFISKKEKMSLIFLSAVMSVLFVINLINSGSEDFNGTLLANFSPAFYTLFKLILLYGGIYFGILFFTTLFHIPTAEAYERKANEVSSLQYFSKLITQVLDFDELVETVAEITTKVSSADAAWIVMKDNIENKIVANKNIALVDASLIGTYLLESGVCDGLSATKLCDLNKFERRSQLSEKFGSIAVSPLKSYSEIKGYLIAARKNDLIFYEEDKSAINTFSDYASVALENSLLLEQSIEKERLEKELDVAREVQRKILPEKDPQFKELDVCSVFIPAFEVGGDYYDFFRISENKLGFVIADVSGKGISAAFIMAEVKGIFTSLSSIIKDPKEILIKANDVLQRTLNKKNFVSALYGILELNNGHISFARAGHCPALLLRKDQVHSFKPSGIALGLTDINTFSDNLTLINIDLEDSDTLVFYTDGITEAKNKELEDFGESRFEFILKENLSSPVDIIANEVIKDVTLFSRNHFQYDDITLVILKWYKKNNIDGVKEWQNSTPQLKTKVL